ncbi:MAG TPA: hypothetical protein VMW19_12335 [Myxococcota bacterium]|nr:hypothetical protein [Myxococcota bacterium]
MTPDVALVSVIVPTRDRSAVPDFAKAIAWLVHDTEESQRLGNAAREWVAATHSRERFLRAFHELANELTVGGPRL